MPKVPKPQHEILRFFNSDHLSPKLAEVVKPFRDLAWQVSERAPMSEETGHALRKLLEAKDCAVRAVLALAVALLFVVSAPAYAQTSKCAALMLVEAKIAEVGMALQWSGFLQEGGMPDTIRLYHAEDDGSWIIIGIGTPPGKTTPVACALSGGLTHSTGATLQ